MSNPSSTPIVPILTEVKDLAAATADNSPRTLAPPDPKLTLAVPSPVRRAEASPHISPRMKEVSLHEGEAEKLLAATRAGGNVHYLDSVAVLKPSSSPGASAGRKKHIAGDDPAGLEQDETEEELRRREMDQVRQFMSNHGGDPSTLPSNVEIVARPDREELIGRAIDDRVAHKPSVTALRERIGSMASASRSRTTSSADESPRAPAATVGSGGRARAASNAVTPVRRVRSNTETSGTASPLGLTGVQSQRAMSSTASRVRTTTPGGGTGSPSPSPSPPGAGGSPSPRPDLDSSSDATATGNTTDLSLNLTRSTSGGGDDDQLLDSSRASGSGDGSASGDTSSSGGPMMEIEVTPDQLQEMFADEPQLASHDLLDLKRAMKNPKSLFDFFCKKGTRAGAGFDEIKEANSVMTIPQFKKFLKEYKIVPDLVEEARVQDIFMDITKVGKEVDRETSWNRLKLTYPLWHSFMKQILGMASDQSRYLLAYKTAHERLHSQTLDNNGQLSAASPLKIMIQSPNSSVSTLASRGGTIAEVGMTAEQRQAIRRAVIQRLSQHNLPSVKRSASELELVSELRAEDEEVAAKRGAAAARRDSASGVSPGSLRRPSTSSIGASASPSKGSGKFEIPAPQAPSPIRRSSSSKESPAPRAAFGRTFPETVRRSSSSDILGNANESPVPGVSSPGVAQSPSERALSSSPVRPSPNVAKPGSSRTSKPATPSKLTRKPPRKYFDDDDGVDEPPVDYDTLNAAALAGFMPPEQNEFDSGEDMRQLEQATAHQRERSLMGGVHVREQSDTSFLNSTLQQLGAPDTVDDLPAAASGLAPVAEALHGEEDDSNSDRPPISRSSSFGVDSKFGFNKSPSSVGMLSPAGAGTVGMLSPAGAGSRDIAASTTPVDPAKASGVVRSSSRSSIGTGIPVRKPSVTQSPVVAAASPSGSDVTAESPSEAKKPAKTIPKRTPSTAATTPTPSVVRSDSKSKLPTPVTAVKSDPDTVKGTPSPTVSRSRSKTQLTPSGPAAAAASTPESRIPAAPSSSKLGKPGGPAGTLKKSPSAERDSMVTGDSAPAAASAASNDTGAVADVKPETPLTKSASVSKLRAPQVLVPTDDHDHSGPSDVAAPQIQSPVAVLTPVSAAVVVDSDKPATAVKGKLQGKKPPSAIKGAAAHSVPEPAPVQVPTSAGFISDELTVVPSRHRSGASGGGAPLPAESPVSSVGAGGDAGTGVAVADAPKLPSEESKVAASAETKSAVEVVQPIVAEPAVVKDTSVVEDPPVPAAAQTVAASPSKAAPVAQVKGQSKQQKGQPSPAVAASRESKQQAPKDKHAKPAAAVTPLHAKTSPSPAGAAAPSVDTAAPVTVAAVAAVPSPAKGKQQAPDKSKGASGNRPAVQSKSVPASPAPDNAVLPAAQQPTAVVPEVKVADVNGAAAAGNPATLHTRAGGSGDHKTDDLSGGGAVTKPQLQKGYSADMHDAHDAILHRDANFLLAWANSKLEPSGLKAEQLVRPKMGAGDTFDSSTDSSFSNALLFGRLAEVLLGLTSPKSLILAAHERAKLSKPPCKVLKPVQNEDLYGIAVKRLGDAGVELNDVSSHDIIRGNRKEAVNLLFRLMYWEGYQRLKHEIMLKPDTRVGQQVQAIEPAGKAVASSESHMLLDWVNQQLAHPSNQGLHAHGGRVSVDSFGAVSFLNGRAFSGVLNVLVPGQIKVGECHVNTDVHNLEFAFDLAKSKLNVPRLVEPDELVVLLPRAGPQSPVSASNAPGTVARSRSGTIESIQRYVRALYLASRLSAANAPQKGDTLTHSATAAGAVKVAPVVTSPANKPQPVVSKATPVPAVAAVSTVPDVQAAPGITVVNAKRALYPREPACVPVPRTRHSMNILWIALVIYVSCAWLYSASYIPDHWTT